MKNPETGIQEEVAIALSRKGVTVWRNETALCWVGRATYQHGSTVVLRHASRIFAGLCKGSADLIGILPDGRFLAIEVKTPVGRLRKEQRNFRDAILANNGVWGVARSASDAIDIWENAR